MVSLSFPTLRRVHKSTVQNIIGGSGVGGGGAVLPMFWPTQLFLILGYDHVGRSTTTKTKPIIHREHVERGQRLRPHREIQHPIQQHF